MFPVFAMAQYVDVGEYRYDRGAHVQVLGKGSFGTVYLGFHKVTKEPVAIKVSLNRDPHMNKHIDSELSIHRQLQHPHLVRCYHVEVRTDQNFALLFSLSQRPPLFDLVSLLSARLL